MPTRLGLMLGSCLSIGAIALPGCGGGGGEPRDTATVVDSAIPIAVQLAQFREGLAPPAAFTDGAPSRAGLIARLADAVEREDSAAFRDLALTRAEFAWLYYPHIPESAPPYELEPGLMWFMLETNSGRGLRTLLTERGGRPLVVAGHTCENERRHDVLTIWGPCAVRRVRAPGDTVAEQLFGPIVERNGVFKFVSYANKL